MAQWLGLFFALCLICAARTSGRNLPFLQDASNEPDPDASNSQLLLHTFVVVELLEEELPFPDEDSPALRLINSLLAKPSSSAVADAESKLPPHFGDSSIASILNQNGLPKGLLPSSVENYTVSDDGQFSVSLSKACYVDFDYEVYYAQTITGTLSYGAISDLSGIQAKKAFIWLSVTGIRADDSSSDYIYFDVGPFSKKLAISQFESIPVCKSKAMDLSALA